MSTTEVTELELLKKVRSERDRRVPKHRQVELRPYKPSSVLPDHQLALAGTITVFFARQGSSLLKEVEAATRHGDTSDRKVARKIHGLFANRKQMCLEEAAKLTASASTIAEIRYAGATLVENITLPMDLEMGVIVLPYNGGELSPGGLQWIEFHHPHVEAGLDVIAVYNQPSLTPAEIAALKLVPAEQVGLNVGYGPGEVACSVLLLTVAVVVEVAVVAVTYTITGSDRRFNAEVSPEAIAELGPVGTAAALLQMRKSILSGERSY